MTTQARKVVFVLGRRRKPDYVRGYKLVVKGRPLVRVQWTEHGQLRTESFDDTRKGIAEAKAFAEGVHERLQLRKPADIPPVTVHALWQAYVTAKVDSWRATTLRNKSERWGKFELYVPPRTHAHLVTQEILDGFKRTLITTPTKRGKPRSVNQVRQMIETVTAVLRWGVDRDLIPPTKAATYQPEFSRDAKRQVVEMAEFSSDERAKVLAQLDPRDSRQWRAYVLTVLFAYCGPRQSAARHLEWRDVDLEREAITWRPELDKMAHERVQPMPRPVLEAMWVAYGWRCTQGYDGPFVFYGVQQRRKLAGKPWTYQAYAKALHDAEARAGIDAVKYRAAHGFRRGIAGDVHAATGSSKTAAEWIGDKSVKIVERHYILSRDEELRKTATLVGVTASSDSETIPSAKQNQNEHGATKGADGES
jgi:integrase